MRGGGFLWRIDIPRFRPSAPKHGLPHRTEDIPREPQRPLDGLERMKHVPQRVSPTFERMTQLTQNAIGDGFVDPVGLRSPVLWHEVGPKQLVPQGKERGIIRPNRIPFIGVMPMVEFRRDDETVQPLETPPHVRMEEQPQDDLSRCESPGQFEGKTGSYKENERRCENGSVQRMSPKPTGPIQMLG